MSNPSVDSPLSPVSTEGRDTRSGRFAAGNKFALGNPNHIRTAEVRRALWEAATPERIRVAADRLMSQAESGDRFAFSEVLDRLLGKPGSSELIERLEQLEAAIAELCGGSNVQR